MVLSTIIYDSVVVMYMVLIIMIIGCRVYENKKLFEKDFNIYIVILSNYIKSKIGNLKPFVSFSNSFNMERGQNRHYVNKFSLYYNRYLIYNYRIVTFKVNNVNLPNTTFSSTVFD